MGSIDLDPATGQAAQQTVGATNHYTAADSGLDKDKPWSGNVWLNPPYSKKLLPEFVEKMTTEISSGHTKSAIMLVNNCTDTEWFAQAQSVCSAVCFTNGRINFKRPTGDEVSPTQGQAFLYYGDDIAKFATEFSKIGHIFVPYRGVP